MGTACRFWSNDTVLSRKTIVKAAGRAKEGGLEAGWAWRRPCKHPGDSVSSELRMEGKQVILRWKKLVCDLSKRDVVKVTGNELILVAEFSGCY